MRTPYSFRVADNGVGVIDEIARRLMICAYLKRDYVTDNHGPVAVVIEIRPTSNRSIERSFGIRADRG